MSRITKPLPWLLAPVAAALVSCAHYPSETRAEPPAFRAEPWEQADRLFHRDPHWVGADDAYTLDLGGGRVLWLFADTWIDPTGQGARTSSGATIVHNSLAIQQGYDPSDAAIRFYWRTGPKGRPAPFFPDNGADYFWPGHGVRIRDRLVIFLMTVTSTDTGFGFDVHDWDAVLVTNPAAEPAAWRLIPLDTPQNDLGIVIGSAVVSGHDGFVYAHGAREPGGRVIYLVRWPEQDLYEGHLARMQWWTDDHDWKAFDAPECRPATRFTDGASEFTVHRDPVTNRYLQIQAHGFGPAVLAVRSALSLTGPWSAPLTLYQPPEHSTPRILIYAGKAHPELIGADLVLTYCTNSFEFRDHFDNPALYYPRFVRLWRR